MQTVRAVTTPRLMSIGASIQPPDGTELDTGSPFLGARTNYMDEYRVASLGVQKATQHGPDEIEPGTALAPYEGMESGPSHSYGRNRISGRMSWRIRRMDSGGPECQPAGSFSGHCCTYEDQKTEPTMAPSDFLCQAIHVGSLCIRQLQKLHAEPTTTAPANFPHIGSDAALRQHNMKV